MVAVVSSEDSTKLQLIERLRHKVSKDQCRPKAIARLSHLLHEHAKTIIVRESEEGDETNNTVSSSLKERLEKEAYDLAKRCVELEPNKSIGYGALSIVSPIFTHRMDALKKAIQIEEEKYEKDAAGVVEFGSTAIDSGRKVGMAVALVRLLVEARDYESKNMTCDRRWPKSSPKHPGRRELNVEERELYTKVKITLENAFDSVNFRKDNLDEVVRSSQPSLLLAKSHYRLGIFFRKLLPGEIHCLNSALHFRTVSRLIPESESIAKKSKFWLATFGMNVESTSTEIDRCPEEYIVSLYSTFAFNFDKLLIQELKYETPHVLRVLVDKVKQTKSTASKRCADLGCGTGLSGLAFRNSVDVLVGIDLSPEMILKAKEKKCYDELLLGDVEAIFCNAKGSDINTYDLIIACDVFVYIGDLRSVFISVRTNLCEKDGLFAFSTEFMEEDNIEGKSYLLQECARFAHKKSYIEELSRVTGFEIKAIKKTVIRKNKGVDVNGLLVVLSCLV